ncbi:MAG: histidine kinase, partial [Bacteroidota bacterium]
LSIRTFSAEDGFDFPVYFPLLQPGLDETCFITCLDGFAEFNPRQLLEIETQTGLQLEQLYINGELFEGEKPYWDGDTLYLNRDQTTLEFQFAAQNFYNPLQNTFQFKLEGWEEKWRTKANVAAADYAQLSPGWYRFRVKARSGHGAWSPERTLVLRIPEAWYEMLLVQLAAGLLVVGLIAFAVNRRIQRSRREARLVAEHEKQLAELELTALRAQMNPHFLFNSLNSIHHFVMNKQPREAANYLTDFSALIRKILSNSRHSAIALKDELDALCLYIKLEQLRFDHRFEFQLEMDPNLDPGFVQVPPLIFQPYVENAILHGLTPLEKGGRLEISFAVEEEHMLCRIRDNGIGREKAAARNQYRDTQHAPLGMNITRKRLAGLNTGAERADSIQIIDLKNGQGQACGTEVRLILPI